jgi:hypothetical protein
VDWLGILIGGGITFVVSLIFYVPSAVSLKREAASLRQHTTLILRGLEEAGKAGAVEYTRNEQGEIVGIAFKRTASSSVPVKDSVDVSSSPETRPQDEEDEDAPAEQE